MKNQTTKTNTWSLNPERNNGVRPVNTAMLIIKLIQSGGKAELFKAIELGATPAQIMIIQSGMSK